MKRKTKLALGGITLLLGAVVLTGCTASFCTVTDQAHMAFAFDYGATRYDANGTETAYIYRNGVYEELTNVKYKPYTGGNTEVREQIYEWCSTYKSIDENATKNGVRLPTVEFLTTFDSVVLGHAIDRAIQDNATINGVSAATWANDLSLIHTEDVLTFKTGSEKGVLDMYGYLKFEDNMNEKKVFFTNYDTYLTETRRILGVDECPSTDYVNLYKSSITSSIGSFRSCLATETGDYGAYGPKGLPVEIQGKAWTDWKGLLEFLLVWPIGALIDVMTKAFLAGGMLSGWAQLLSIFLVTMIIRTLMMAFTLKQTSSTAKMSELQPEIQKIQAKYPNANTNQYDKQRMAAEMQKLYKKHKINPLSSILVMIVQFPVFICVWGALQGSAYLSSGTFLNLRLSDPIGSTMFNASNWDLTRVATGGGSAVTALLLFILMAVAQAFAMLLPQFIQKKKAKEAVKLGKNPAQDQQANRMKWFTWIMLAMIIFMGFSLASGMGVYWFFGALFSIAQTLIMQVITKKRAQRAKYGKEKVSAKKKGK